MSLRSLFPTGTVCVLYLDIAEHWHCIFCVFQVQHISTAALVWLWSRTDLQKSFLPIVMVFMAITCYRPLLIEWVLPVIFFLNKCYTLSSYVFVHSFFSFCLKRASWRYMFHIFEIHSEILHHVHVFTVITIIILNWFSCFIFSLPISRVCSFCQLQSFYGL